MWTQRRFGNLAAAVAAAAALLCSRAQAHQLLRDYRFVENLTDSSGKGPELKKTNGALGNGTYAFREGEGLELERSGVTDHYTVEITFKFEDTASWQKIVDFKKGASDNGLYVYEGRLQFYNLAIGGDFQAGQEYRVRIERDKGTNLVKAYLNGSAVWEFTDTAGDAVFDGESAVFFLDDAATGGQEVSAGVATRLRIWDAPADN